MLPDRVSNPGPLTYESGALPITLYENSKDEKTLALKTGDPFSKVTLQTNLSVNV